MITPDPARRRPRSIEPLDDARPAGRSTRTPGSACARTRCSARTAAGIYGVVHFKNRAVGVLPVDETGRVWLVGQYRYPLDAYSWEIPEGGVPRVRDARGRRPIRELREETGLSPAGSSCVATSHLSNSVSDELGLRLPGDRADRRTRATRKGTERIDVRRFEWEEAWGMLEARRDHRLDERDRPLHEAVRRLERRVRGESASVRARS